LVRVFSFCLSSFLEGGVQGRSPGEFFSNLLSGYNKAQYKHLSIYKKAFDLLVYFERIVKNFSRYHKNTHGSALHNIA